ncbi:hypothetical protein C8J56DRAFT_507083 [Mycena floridula]|nr:hypothetical protein C8J56DRAFT_507083 [Mycena floridula]
MNIGEKALIAATSIVFGEKVYICDQGRLSGVKVALKFHDIQEGLAKAVLGAESNEKLPLGSRKTLLVLVYVLEDDPDIGFFGVVEFLARVMKPLLEEFNFRWPHPKTRYQTPHVGMNVNILFQSLQVMYQDQSLLPFRYPFPFRPSPLPPSLPDITSKAPTPPAPSPSLTSLNTIPSSSTVTPSPFSIVPSLPSTSSSSPSFVFRMAPIIASTFKRNNRISPLAPSEPSKGILSRIGDTFGISRSLDMLGSSSFLPPVLPPGPITYDAPSPLPHPTSTLRSRNTDRTSTPDRRRSKGSQRFDGSTKENAGSDFEPPQKRRKF